MARTEIVVGEIALSASLAAGGTGSVQLDAIGGFQTFSSGSYNSGRKTPARFLRPNSDITASNFQPSPAFSELTELAGEVTSSDVSAVSPSSSVMILEVALAGADLADRNRPISIRVTAAKSGAFAVATGSIGDNTASLTVLVVEEATVRAIGTFSNIGLENEEFSFNLTESEKSSIGNWENVAIRSEFSMSVVTASSTVNGIVTQVLVQVADGGVRLFEAPPVDARIFRLTWGI